MRTVPVDSISVPPLGDFALPGIEAGDVRIELSTRARGRLAGAVGVNVLIADADTVLKRGVVTARVEASTRVWVAARSLARGARLTERDLRLERVDLQALPPGATARAADLVGFQLRRALREGAVVRTRFVEPVSLVERGQIVRIVVHGAGLEIVGKGRAVTDGALGEQIRVVNTDSRREILGRVASDGAVHVDL